MKFNIKQLILLIGVVLMLSFVACSSVPQDVASAGIGESSGTSADLTSATWKAIDFDSSTFEFEGYAPGKSHIGTFDVWSGELGFVDGKIVAAKGTIDPASVNTGIGGLDNHLKTDDFFDVENYPEIVIETLDIDYGVMIVTADLTFRGVTKTITFPFTATENSISADFLLDVTPFNFKYVAINDEVRIAFNFIV